MSGNIELVFNTITSHENKGDTYKECRLVFYTLVLNIKPLKCYLPLSDQQQQECWEKDLNQTWQQLI